jgi:hypothetical protein
MKIVTRNACAYAVFGAFGITLYLGHLADVVFKDSLFFPFALSLIGRRRRLALGEPARRGVAIAARRGCERAPPHHEDLMTQ